MGKVNIKVPFGQGGQVDKPFRFFRRCTSIEHKLLKTEHEPHASHLYTLFISNDFSPVILVLLYASITEYICFTTCNPGRQSISLLIYAASTERK
jgi:hypothetical protein